MSEIILDASGNFVATTNSSRASSTDKEERNAAELVRLANEHAELLVALVDITERRKEMSVPRYSEILGLIARLKTK